MLWLVAIWVALIALWGASEGVRAVDMRRWLWEVRHAAENADDAAPPH